MRGQDIVDFARTCLGTPYHHAGRVPGLHGGMDCSGLLVVVMLHFGIDVKEHINYSDRSDNYERMVASISLYTVSLEPTETLKAGDVLIFRRGSMLNHCGIYTDKAFIHSASPLGCCEQTYDTRWQAATTHRMRYRGTE